ncbi:MAG: group II intron maturase-specific domain-containing protein [Solirubrobacteraceae bacterium]
MLKAEKTAITHIDEGFVFLGQRIVRRPKGHKRYVYTFVSREALTSIRRKVKALTGRSTTNLELSELIAALNPILRGWANHFRHAAAKHTFDNLGYYAWWRIGAGFARSTRGARDRSASTSRKPPEHSSPSR